ncbi:MAG: hypothetical protein K2M96_00250 [Prevotella sp.]|nr:hypothetical protein [Prevotella sp.]MDE7455119.1 hypothetical protein [Prevotella sp.]
MTAGAETPCQQEQRHGLWLHHAPTRFAPCADRIRIVCRHAPHMMPTHSASCTDAVRTTQEKGFNGNYHALSRLKLTETDRN